MTLLALPAICRGPVFGLALGLIYGLCVLIAGSAAAGIYLAAIPAFGVWMALWRPWRRWLSVRHVVYLAMMAALLAGGMGAFARMTPSLHVRWTEILVAVYFLAALHVLLWTGDRLLNKALVKALWIPPAGPRPRARLWAKGTIRVLALIFLGGPVVAAAMTTHWIRFDEAPPQAVGGAEFTKVGFLAADGTAIRGYYLPNPLPYSEWTVVLVPGRGMGKTGLAQCADTLRDDGYSVLLLDMRGEGGSGGNTRGFGVTESQDVSAAVDYLRRAHPRGSEHVFVLGFSQGATAAVQAAKDDARIEAVIADSAFPSPKEELGSSLGWLPGPLGDYFQNATLALASAQVGRNLFHEGLLNRLKDVSPRPVLLIYGGQDRELPAGSAERIYASAGTPALLWKVTGAGHAESLLLEPQAYAEMVKRTLSSVRLGAPAFGWAKEKAGQS